MADHNLKHKRFFARGTMTALVALCGITGCDNFPVAQDIPTQREIPPLTIRTLPEVGVDMSVDVSARRYHTALVPVAITADTLNAGPRLAQQIEQAAFISDCFVARPRMDWVEFGPLGEGRLNIDLVAAVNLTRDNGTECIVIEIDPVSDRRNVGLLPPELEGMDFSDDPVRDPIERMAIQIAIQFQPTYLSIGVEMNGYYEAHPDDFLNYVDLHKQVYDSVKAVAPSVQVIGAFNLEGMQGFFGDLDEFSNHGPQWFLINMLEPKLDAVAFSSLPFPLFFHPSLIPDDYLSRIELYTSRDILFTEIGWPGDPNALVHTPPSQAQYLAHLIRLIDGMNQVKLVTWATLFDPSEEAALRLHPDFQSLGLIDNKDNEKPALEIWQTLHQLPYQP